MDDDEILVLFASAVWAARAGLRWYIRLLACPSPIPRHAVATRIAAGVWPLALLFALYETLIWGAAREVRTEGDYILLFLSLGAVWISGLSWASGWLGIHPLDDMIERKNVAAAIAVGGTVSGGMIVFAGANLGEGSTIWMTIEPALMATAFALALWGAHHMLSGAADAITLDRDVASAIRFAGMTLGTGLIIGRAAAGDYVSADATARDLFVQGSPAFLLMGLNALIQRWLRPTKELSRPPVFTRGLLPGVVCLGLGTAAVLWPERWSWAVGQ